MQVLQDLLQAEGETDEASGMSPSCILPGLIDLQVNGYKGADFSGGDLTEPVTLTKTGPASPRPSGVPVPPDPDQVPPAR